MQLGKVVRNQVLTDAVSNSPIALEVYLASLNFLVQVVVIKITVLGFPLGVCIIANTSVALG